MYVIRDFEDHITDVNMSTYVILSTTSAIFCFQHYIFESSDLKSYKYNFMNILYNFRIGANIYFSKKNIFKTNQSFKINNTHFS